MWDSLQKKKKKTLISPCSHKRREWTRQARLEFNEPNVVLINSGLEKSCVQNGSFLNCMNNMVGLACYNLSVALIMSLKFSFAVMMESSEAKGYVHVTVLLLRIFEL